MIDRYNIELTPDYLNNVCTADKRFGMYPTIEMIEMYNTINFRNSIVPDIENSQLRALFAQIIPTTADNLFAQNRFKKLVGYKNNIFPLSKRFPTLQEISNELTNISTVHDVANYDKFARMLQIVSEHNDIPVSFNRVETWETEKTDTPNETITTESETTNNGHTTDNTEKTETGTAGKTGTEATVKTGTEATAKTGTETTGINETNTKTGTDSTLADNHKSINETVTQKVAPFDSDSYNNNEETTTTNQTNDNGMSSTTYNTTDTKTGTDTLTHNTTETITHNTTNTTTYNTTDTDNTTTTTDRTIANTDSGEKSETKTRTGENEATENGKRLINTGLSMAELIERENVLMPVFDMYLMSIAREITLTCVDDVW